MNNFRKKIIQKIGDQNVETHLHYANFGNIKIGSETVSLSGPVYSPILPAKSVSEDIIASVMPSHISWLSSVGLIPSVVTEEMRADIQKKSFLRFVQATHLSFDAEKVAQILQSEGTSYQKITRLLSDAAKPLSAEKTLLSTNYLHALFMHDDFAEKLKSDCLEAFNGLIKEVLDFPSQRIQISDAKQLLKIKWDNFSAIFGDRLGAAKEKFFALGTAFLDVSYSLHKGFKRLTQESPDLIGYNDFKAEFIRYLDSTEQEARTRESGQAPSKETFYKLRLYTCAVSTVYMTAILASELKIPKSLRETSTGTRMLEDLVSCIICETNALFSAERESNTPNWLHNDLCILKNDLDETMETLGLTQDSQPISSTYTQASKMLFAKINHEMVDLRLQLDKTGSISDEGLLYLAIVLHWGFGSIPAQGVAERYFWKDTENTPHTFLQPEDLQRVGDMVYDPIFNIMRPLTVWNFLRSSN